MPAKRNTLVDYLSYLALRVLETFVRMFDVQTTYAVCDRLGDLMYCFDRRHRHRALEHLRRSFPGYEEARLRRIARLSMRNLMYLGLEVVLTTRRISTATWRRAISFRNVEETIRLMLERRCGLIMVTGHFGNWEVIGYTMAVLGFPTVSVARPLDNPYVNEHIMGIRERTGQSILYKRGATLTMHDVLEGRGALSFIADQDVGRKGIFVDFFGRPASTYKSVALMAIEHQVPIVVGYGRRLGRGFRFEIGIERVIRPHQWAGKDDPVRWITQEYTAALEEAIRRAPEQYVWTHRRWKTRPKGEQPGPDGVA